MTKRLLLLTLLSAFVSFGVSFHLGSRGKKARRDATNFSNEEIKAARPSVAKPSVFPLGISSLFLITSLAFGSEASAADIAVVKPAQSPPGTPTTLLLSSEDQQSILGLFGKTTKEVFGLISEDEKEVRLREFDAKFEQDYQDRNQEYAEKLRKKKQSDGQELQEEKQFVNKGVMDNYVYGAKVSTDRGDSILPKSGVATGLFPDMFNAEERAKIQAREEENLQKQQLNIQRSEAIQREEEEAKAEKQEKGKLGDTPENVIERTKESSGPEKPVQTWDI